MIRHFPAVPPVVSRAARPVRAAMLGRLAVAALLALAAPTGALAHAHLKASSPAAASVLPAAPGEVSIDFTEQLEPRFSTIEVTDAAGARVDRDDVHVEPHKASHLVVGLKPLPAGTYTVSWHATSTDTHKTQGSFSFTVAP
jgi:methionine-rich copper-binding protein CopC